MEEERNELFSAIKGFDNSRLKHQTPRVTHLGSMVAGIDSTGWRSFGSYAVFGTGNDASNDRKGNEGTLPSDATLSLSDAKNLPM